MQQPSRTLTPWWWTVLLDESGKMVSARPVSGDPALYEKAVNDDCRAAIALTKQLNDEPVNSHSEKELERAYTRIIKKHKFLKPELAGYVARAAARLSFIYEPVKRARKKQLARERKLELS
jgi:hypothetical protein